MQSKSGWLEIGFSPPPLKTKFLPQNQSPKTTYLTLLIKSSIGYSPMVSMCLAKKTCLDLGVSTTCVS